MRPQDAAGAVRSRLGLDSNAPCHELVEAIELRLGVPVWLLDLPEGVSGVYAASQGQGFIFASSREAAVRRRFTVAHEVGHHVLGHGSIVDPEGNLAHDVAEPLERDANSFAAELLLPTNALMAWWREQPLPPVTLESVTRLAYTYGVSAKMAFWRLVNSQMVGSRGTTFDVLLPQIEAGEHLILGRDLDLPSWADAAATTTHRGRRNPSRLLDAARSARNAELLSDQKIAELLEVPAGTLDAQLG